MRVCLAAIALSFAVAGCGALGGGGSKAPVAITQAQLEIMVVPQDELGSAYATLTTDSESGRTTSREFAGGTLDPKDTGGSVKRDGWRGGYQLAFSDSRTAALKRGQGLLSIGTSVDLFASESAARSEILKYVRYFENHRGRSVEGLKIKRFEAFDVELGDDAWGMEYTIKAGGLHGTETEVLFHLGRVVGSASVIRVDETAARVEAVQLARLLESRTERVLAGELHAKPVSLAGTKPRIPRKRIAAMTLGARDLPASAKLEDEHLDRTHDDFIAYIRTFALPEGKLGGSTVGGVRAETNVYADSGGVAIMKKVLSGPEAHRFFRAAFHAAVKEQGVPARRVRSRPLHLTDGRMRGLVLSYTCPQGRFDATIVVVDSGRAQAWLTLFGPTGKVKTSDAEALAAKAGARLP